ncbi:MAG: hypothetical protein MRZ98_00855 [Clostridiales bacterium]|nr:hypothetical protein [Clostridiales bacterium]
MLLPGATCDVAENGQVALKKFVTSKHIRASGHPEARTILGIAMTVNAFVRDVQDALEAGMNAHIAKPINLETLRDTLASCIRR